MKTTFRQLSAMITWWGALMERRRQRRSLANLNDHLLRDIGITRYDVAQEIKKLF